MSDRIGEEYDAATERLVEAAREALVYLPPRRAEPLRKAIAHYERKLRALITRRD